MRLTMWCIFGALFLAVAARAQTQAAASEIILGQSAAFTGSPSKGSSARLLRDGALLYFQQVNQSGGIHGRNIRLISLDDGQDPTRAVANTHNLIEKENVVALIDFENTTPILAAKEVAIKAHVPFFAAYSGGSTLYSYNKYVFTVRASFKDEVRGIVRHLTSLGIKNIGLVYYDLDSGKELFAQTRDLLGAEYLSLEGAGMMKFNSSDPEKAVKDISSHAPKAIILGVSSMDAVSFIRQMKTKTLSRPIYFSRALVNPKVLRKELGDDAVGIAITQTAPNPFRTSTPISREYRDALMARDGSVKPEYLEFEGYISAKALVVGLKRAVEPLTGDHLVSALESLGDVNLGGYHVDFSSQNHNGSSYVDIAMIGSGGRTID